ncbi:hypothetical protein AAMO2058_001516400 [Amorphochlora amoebiformis]
MHGHAKPQVDAVANNRMISLKESEARKTVGIVTLLIGVVGALSNWITHSGILALLLSTGIGTWRTGFESQ